MAAVSGADGMHLAMEAGDGETSYARNSSPQKQVVTDSYETIATALALLTIPAEGPVVVADLGCSSGTNTINHVHFIIDTLKKHWSGEKLPEFQVLFQDLPANDFNLLFGYLSRDSKLNSYTESGTPSCLIAGIPGSFYKRLVPKSTVHVFFSSLSVHWLSKVPDAVCDKNSPAYSRNFLWTNRGNPSTVAAFKEQSKLDLQAFLSARAEETVPGGLVIVVYSSRLTKDPTCTSHDPFTEDFWYTLEEVGNELVSEGIITEESRNSFNLPLYLRSAEDMQEVLEDFGSVFSTECMQRTEDSLKMSEDPEQASVAITKVVRSGFSVVFSSHFGVEVNDLFWLKFQRKVEEKMKHKLLADNSNGFEFKHISQLLVLRRR